MTYFDRVYKNDIDEEMRKADKVAYQLALSLNKLQTMAKNGVPPSKKMELKKFSVEIRNNIAVILRDANALRLAASKD